MLDPRNDFCLSMASAWEIAIKHAAGKLELPEDPHSYIQSRTAEDGVTLMPIRLEHVSAAAAWPRHHTDPSDRLLVAKARAERSPLISHDSTLARYDLTIIDPAR